MKDNQENIIGLQIIILVDVVSQTILFQPVVEE